MEFELDRAGPLPLYQQIESWMRQHILLGNWPEHSQIPAEDRLAEQLAVNRGTLRKAITALISEGLLSRVHGKGTFVTPSRLEQPLADSLITFSESLLERNIPYQTKVRGARVTRADTRVASLLGLTVGTEVFHLERVRYVNGQPVVILNNHVVYSQCEGIERTNFEEARLFDVLEKDYGLTIDWGQRTFEATAASSEAAELLEVPSGAPVMYVQQLSYLKGSSPIELSDLWFRGDQFRLSAQVKRMRLTGNLREILVKNG